MKILKYGVGVIGLLYAALFSQNRDVKVSVYARGKRLKELRDSFMGIYS